MNKQRINSLADIASSVIKKRELGLAYLRYEAIKKMSRLELLELYTKGKRFYDLVDRAVIRNNNNT